jgi:8-oxo-dGTP pyrophosphatase MutT (NUDIX family)
MEPHCGNCGKGGHVFHQCKMPIISMGIIAFSMDMSRGVQYLMIRRKDTLGFMDFMRGKYSLYNKEYILNLLNEMTLSEKRDILEKEFPVLWKQLWGNQSGHYKGEEETSREKFYALRAGIMNDVEYSLSSLIGESDTKWTEAEWGFPKGRRNSYEKDLDCALREFVEETGYDVGHIVENIQPYEEIFMGSNHRCYKHKYYLMYIPLKIVEAGFDKSEVSKIEWKTYEECLASIRPYNLEKIRIIQDIHKSLEYLCI